MSTEFERLRNFNKKADLEMDPSERINDMISEIGELSKEILKATEYGDSELKMNSQIKDEFGDVYYCLLSLAEELNIDPDEALEQSLDKYQERFEEKEHVGSGD